MASTIYKATNGVINFYSTAPQELIHALSKELVGALDIEKRTFAFKIGIISFQGFNNALQREHFNENYMESTLYPVATYTGKIIEDIDLQKDGEYTVRTKGKMLIHGVESERLIKADIICSKGKIVVHSEFTIQLSDYDIKIPRIVDNKLANDIRVTVNITFLPGA